MNIDTIVKIAIENTDPEYWKKTCAMRAGRDPGRLGSYFPLMTAEMVSQLVKSLVWEPYTHTNVKPPARAFVARDVPGSVLGIMRLADVPEDAELVWDDTKDTGKVELVWKGGMEKGNLIKPDFLVLLVGPDDFKDEDGLAKPVVWTFFPGDPIAPSQIERRFEAPDQTGFYTVHDRHGRRASKAGASGLVQWVKLA